MPEPLERGPPGGAQDITDLPPAMAGGPRLIDGLLQRLAGGGGKLSGRRHGSQRRAGAGHLVREPARSVADPARHRIGRSGPVTHKVKVAMTLDRPIQHGIYDVFSTTPGRPADGRYPLPAAGQPRMTSR